MKSGFIIEYNIRDEDGTIYPNVIMSSREFGQRVFNDLVEGMKAGSVSFDKDIEGAAGMLAKPVLYDRAFVVLP